MAKGRELLSESSDSSDSESGGAEIPDLQVNQEYAKRFEHNKKREELARLEDKLGKSSSRKRKRGNDDDDGSESDSSSSEDEDDEGELATAALDNEIFATLNAIRSKDPRVYDESATFYTEIDENDPTSVKEKKEKPVYLRDYHRENLLNGVKPDDAEDQPMSYNQQQDQLKKSIVSDFHAAAEGSEESDSEEEGGLLVRKNKSEAAKTRKPATLDIEQADKDPETFLSNFMAARAWVPTDTAELHPFESDDEEEEKRAEEFEEAWNMRFENPEKSNEKLSSYARDTAARYSVRREEKNSRKKKRDAEKAAKEEAKRELKEDKARLKKLRMEEIEEKVKRIKRAAGLKSGDLKPEDWARFIDDDWDDSKWEAEMQKRFDEQYYAEKDEISADSDADEDGEGGTKVKKRKLKKPKFDDDIDIKDIIPDFEDEEEAANFSLTEDDDEAGTTKLKEKKKSKKQDRIDRQKDSKKERRIIEQLVDDQLQLELDHALPATSRNKSAGFRYRETSPQSFGLTHRDILLADDSALNQFAGLKKLASWREEEKKKKDKKHLGKKARLRKWRQETFGDEEGLEGKDLTYSGQPKMNGADGQEGSDQEMGGVDIREGGKKKKARRRKKVKTSAGEVSAEA
ncbi:Kinetochore protein Spc24 [Knufia obscura]|uniref:Kinetochore protein Spc24 n=2 Tax=Knufia TaxID=430999 RepID=A0AAN8IHY4_9EURO|nr:Kinetochore protein Spc24 [Knufia obscura]KAK5948547.1 Kinetochore protein Spc24 [Knufia fluminis]